MEFFFVGKLITMTFKPHLLYQHVLEDRGTKNIYQGISDILNRGDTGIFRKSPFLRRKTTGRDGNENFINSIYSLTIHKAIRMTMVNSN